MAFEERNSTKMVWVEGEAPSPVLVWHDARGNRYFMVRPSRGKYDMRIVVEGHTTADQRAVSAKIVEVTARTLSLELPPERLYHLARTAQLT